MRRSREITEKLNTVMRELSDKKDEVSNFTQMDWVLQGRDSTKRIYGLKAEIEILKWVLKL